ncbi:MAG: thiosulfate oxidation carrier complex protein SoxZ [Acetobacteraceae bacterium]
MAAPIGQPRVRLPSGVKAGDVVEIRTLITHPMETGQRRDTAGAVIPRDIIRSFVARFDGQEVFRMDLHPAVSANPYIAFAFRAERSGTFEFTWTNDEGARATARAELRVG